MVQTTVAGLAKESSVVTESPQVGIFWALCHREASPALLTAKCTLQNAEHYGACLTFPAGHLEVWDEWRRSGTDVPRLPPAVFQEAEYEDWPRGRIVYDTETATFIVYADRRIFAARLTPEIRDHFGLPTDRVHYRLDSHYRSTRRLTNRAPA